MTPSNMNYQTVLNAIPVPTFVVDQDVSILDLNRSAIDFCGQDRGTVYRRRGGEVLRCLHVMDVPEGCGKGPLCKNCVIRSSVNKCIEAHAVSRKIMRLQTVREEVVKEIEILVTVSPLSDSEKLALLMVEDITDRQHPLYNISPETPVSRISKVAQEVKWESRPRTLHEFPEDTRGRLRQLDFNRVITVCVGDEALYVKRIGLDRFLWRAA